MKMISKTNLMIPVFCVLVATSAWGDTNNAADNSTVPPTITESNLNSQPAPQKKHKEPHDRSTVRIDNSGIHVADPEDGNVDIALPQFPKGFASSDGVGFGAAVIALAGIIVPFLFLGTLGLLYFTFRHRRQKILHETLRAMIDKGVPIPPELIVPPGRIRRRAGSDLRSGLVIMGAGLGILLFFGRAGFGRIGWIPVFIGIAFLITWFIERKNSNNDLINK
jgi:hypothetical protein